MNHSLKLIYLLKHDSVHIYQWSWFWFEDLLLERLVLSYARESEDAEGVSGMSPHECVRVVCVVSWLYKIGRQCFPTSKHILERSEHLASLLSGWLWKASYITACDELLYCYPLLISHMPQTQTEDPHPPTTPRQDKVIYTPIAQNKLQSTNNTVERELPCRPTHLTKHNDSLLLSKTRKKSFFFSACCFFCMRTTLFLVLCLRHNLLKDIFTWMILLN